MTLERVRLRRPEKSYISVGLRGVGKTVLLQEVKKIAEDAKFRTCFIEAHEGKSLPSLLIPHLRRILMELDRMERLNEHVKRGLRVLKSFMSSIRVKTGEAEIALDIEPEAGSADSGDIEADLPELFAAIGRAAAARDTVVALMIDEIQYLSERDMSGLIMAIHRTVQEGLPIAMMAAGLPQVVGLSGRSKSYAERLFDFPTIDALGRDNAILAIQNPALREGAEFEAEALEEVVRVTRGYPYFLQTWGYHAWNAASSRRITYDDVVAATHTAIKALDESFFRVRFDRLTPREKDYLRAMAELGSGPHRSGEIAERLGRGTQSLGPLRSGLIVKGMIFSPAHGDTEFTVPMFDEFLKRTIPVWQSPYRAQAHF